MSHRLAKAVRRAATLVYRSGEPRTYYRHGKPAALHVVRVITTNPDGTASWKEEPVQLHAQGGQLKCAKRGVYQSLKRHLKAVRREPTVTVNL